MQASPNTSNFRSFLRAFAANWSAAVSGGLSVPFAFLALYFSNGYQRMFWGILAVAGLITASYRVWSDKVRELALTTNQLEKDKANNERPILRGNIETLYVEVYKHLDSTPQKHSDAQLYVKALIYNESKCPTTIRCFGLVVEDAFGRHDTEYLGELNKKFIQRSPGHQDSVGQVLGRKIEHMPDLGLETSSEPVTLGLHRLGWLRFKVSGVEPLVLEQGTFRLTAIDSFGAQHEICSCKHPPKGTGEVLTRLYD